MSKRTRFPNPDQANLARITDRLAESNKTFYENLTGESLPPVRLSGWARVGTGKFHHYQEGVSSCSYQRKAGVLTFADTQPLDSVCCSSCTNNIRKAARDRKQASPTTPAERAGAPGTIRGKAARDARRGEITGAWLEESTQLDPKQLDQLYGAPTVQRQPLPGPPAVGKLSIEFDLFLPAFDPDNSGRVLSYGADQAASIDKARQRQAILDGNPT